MFVYMFSTNVFCRHFLSHRGRLFWALSDEGKNQRVTGEEGTDMEWRKIAQLNRSVNIVSFTYFSNVIFKILLQLYGGHIF